LINIDFYLPKEALQGQDVPCHLIWSKIKWSSIEIQFSKELRIVDVYNVDEQEIKKKRNGIVIKKLNRDGYLCVEFEAKRLKDLSRKAIVSTIFYFRDEIICRMEREINLFRPNLQLVSIPKKIIIDKQGKPSQRLQLRREGFGTVIVAISCTDDSEVQCIFPSGFIEMMKQVMKDVNIEISKLKKRYPEYSEIFNVIDGLDETDYSSRDEMLNKVSATIEHVQPEEKFMDELANAMFTAMIKNSDFENIVIRPIVEFMKSAIGNQIIFSTPFIEIECDDTEKELKIDIESFDLLASEISRIEVTPIKIRGEKNQRIQIGELIDWKIEKKSR